MKRITLPHARHGRRPHAEDQARTRSTRLCASSGLSCSRDVFSRAYLRPSPRLRPRRHGQGPRILAPHGAELGVAWPAETQLGRARATADLESWFNMRPAMIDFSAECASKVGRLVLLSNIHADGARYLREGEGRRLGSPSSTSSCSPASTASSSPSVEIYELALDVAGALPGETLFVDDSPVNVEGALSLRPLELPLRRRGRLFLSPGRGIRARPIKRRPLDRRPRRFQWGRLIPVLFI